MTNGNYTDWKLGVTKDLGGWVIGASYIDTNAKGNCNAAPTDPQPYCFSNGNACTARRDKSRTPARHRRALGQQDILILSSAAGSDTGLPTRGTT